MAYTREAERKFQPSPEELANAVNSPEFSVIPVNTKVITDVYYDNVQLGLTTQDSWLRVRDNKWELKIAEKGNATSETDSYREITSPSEIAKKLGISLADDNDLSSALEREGYTAFATIVTNRKTYQTKDHDNRAFKMVVDIMNFGDPPYSLVEIERVTRRNRATAEAAVGEINAFASRLGLSLDSPVSPRGKVIEYLRLKRPSHFISLIRAGVIRASQLNDIPDFKQYLPTNN
jgi:adenylate cyclase class IV